MTDDERTEVLRSLARIEAKLDRVIEDAEDHEIRLRRLERWMWTAVGLSLSGAAAGLSAWLTGG